MSLPDEKKSPAMLRDELDGIFNSVAILLTYAQSKEKEH